MSGITLHLIANAHLDPVWCWDWREGVSEALTTTRTILDLMDEDGELSFVRGESFLYEQIERLDPAAFERIRAYAARGRWDVIGGTVIQSDMNLPSIEALARQFVAGQTYFKSRFGKPARVAWSPDAFGHAAGLPEALAQAGIEGYAFHRPHSRLFPLEKPIFWWEGPGGSRVMGYRILPVNSAYCTERSGVKDALDRLLAEAKAFGFDNAGFFYGLGDHGGGPTRRHLKEIREWASDHPEVRVLHSGLHALFDALKEEVALKGDGFLPVHRGEINFCFRGCYASAARLKFAYRKAEATLLRTERTDAAIGAALSRPANPLEIPWKAVLFNGFHDILPGSAIERAMEDQIAWLGGGVHASQRAEMEALLALADAVDTRVEPPEADDRPTGVSMLLWNPHPWAFDGHVQFEACLDYRPIWEYMNRASELPFRVLSADGSIARFHESGTEHPGMRDFPWRKAVVARCEIPAFGWTVIEIAWREDAKAPSPPEKPARAVSPGVIENGAYRIEAREGEAGIRIFHDGAPVFDGEGLTAAVYEDPWGAWGGMNDEPESLDISTVRETWRIAKTEILEAGPERATLWVRLAGATSRIDLTISLESEREAVDFKARVLWDERSARLKLSMPGFGEGEFDVPGAVVRRGACGEVPGGRWVRAFGERGSLGFASDALYGFDFKEGAFRATVLRSSRYADDAPRPADQEIWRPATDGGEHQFRFLLGPGDDRLPRLAAELSEPPVVLKAPSGPGALPRTGSLAAIDSPDVACLALKHAEDGNGFVLRLQNKSETAREPRFAWLGERLSLGEIPPWVIRSWRLTKDGERWSARVVNLIEAEE